ncbi:glucuronyl hydrolase [Tamlana fucoidanivorans]|uniref:Glucuronyl hydrolase n=2 Tax=Allotamlana fucoidanivorans TaxID=2583814 RepID=A0A5C4SPU6_9FLAO|nr:glucuronyl hydrolase [Tamlana fucoidanivorans]
MACITANHSNPSSRNYTINKSSIETIFKKASIHYGNVLDSVIQYKKFPRSSERGFKPAEDWTSGFYPGCLWQIYDQTKSKEALNKAKEVTGFLYDQRKNTRDHDIGFRMYCSYGQGFNLTGNKDYKTVLIESAKSALARFNPKVGAIMSWEPNPQRDWQYPVIVDNMMNLELLFAATKLSGDSTYYHAAVSHATKTMVNHYRKDFSCPHVVDYNSKTGKFRKMDWNNGENNVEYSAWSRGQSWGLYGFTVAYRETGDKRFLIHAENIARFILDHPNMPDDSVPYWDYRAPREQTMRDASAAAILASALLELSELSNKAGHKYFTAAEKILYNLMQPKYLADPETNNNFLLKHATGNYLRNSELDAGLIYADYYFLEALNRYSKKI